MMRKTKAAEVFRRCSCFALTAMLSHRILAASLHHRAAEASGRAMRSWAAAPPMTRQAAMLRPEMARPADQPRALRWLLIAG